MGGHATSFSNSNSKSHIAKFEGQDFLTVHIHHSLLVHPSAASRLGEISSLLCCRRTPLPKLVTYAPNVANVLIDAFFVDQK